MPDANPPMLKKPGIPAPDAGSPPPRRLQLRNFPRQPGPDQASPQAGGLISLAYADASPDVRRRVEARINGRPPLAFPLPASAAASVATEHARLAELDRALRRREQEADAREESLMELQARLQEREREIAELENLQCARQHVLLARSKATASALHLIGEEEKPSPECNRNEPDPRPG